MRMWNLIVGHAEDAGLRSGLLKGMRIPGRPRAYGTAAAHSIAFGSCEPTNSFAIPDKPHTQTSSWTSEQSERRSRTHYHREEFGEDSWLHFAPPIPPWGNGSWLSPGRRLSVSLAASGRGLYRFASPACSTALHAAGICASVIGGFGFGGSGGGFGCSTPSLNQ